MVSPPVPRPSRPDEHSGRGASECHAAHRVRPRPAALEQGRCQRRYRGRSRPRTDRRRLPCALLGRAKMSHNPPRREPPGQETDRRQNHAGADLRRDPAATWLRRRLRIRAIWMHRAGESEDDDSSEASQSNLQSWGVFEGCAGVRREASAEDPLTSALFLRPRILSTFSRPANGYPKASPRNERFAAFTPRPGPSPCSLDMPPPFFFANFAR